MKQGLYRVLALAMLLLSVTGFFADAGHADDHVLAETAVQAARVVVSPAGNATEEIQGSKANTMPVTSPVIITGDPEPIVPPPAHPLRVALDWYLTPYHAALIVARERGLFEREGLEVTLTQPADPTVPPKLVAAQHVELALTSQPRLHLLVDQGLPLIRVGTLVPLPLATLIVRQEANLQSLSDIQGKTVGYVFEEPARLLLDGVLEKHALSSDDVELKRIDFGLNSSLAEAEVDAVVGAQRHVTRRQLEQSGIRVVEFPLGETDLPLYDELILIANRDSLQQHGTDIRRFLDALQQATLWLINHPDDAWELIRRAEPGLDTQANADAWPDTLRYLALRPAAVQAERYHRFETYLLQQGLIESLTPANRLATDITHP